MEQLIDKFGRKIYYLRISVTDRCNYRCAYCMPKDGINWKPMSEILTYEEISDFVTVASQLGIRRIKLTGGEPLVRKGIDTLVKMLKETDGIEEVSLTTNGSLLKKYAKNLKEAGLDRITISLDTLDKEKFKKITRFGNLDDVIEGIDQVISLGFENTKLNTVVMKHINDNEIIDLIDFASEKKLDIRFIELMPTDLLDNWQQHFISIEEIKGIIKRHFELVPARKKSNGPAVHFKTNNCFIGFITPLSRVFCSECNRIRLTSDGYILPCLGHSDKVEVKGALRRRDLNKVKELIKYSVEIKPKEHSLLSEHIHSSMASVGG